MVTKEAMNNSLPYIVAVDFDGTLVEDKFPEIGAPYPQMFQLLQRVRDKGHKLILWTCRTDTQLEEAVRFCKDNFNWEFDSVNENLPETIALFGGSARKVYANEYWDDKAVCFQFNAVEGDI